MKHYHQKNRGILKAGLKDEVSKLRELVQQQSDFIAVTVHELRTPLTIAMLQLESTLSSKVLMKPVRKDLKVLEESLEQLNHLTKELFDAQQYDLKKVEPLRRKIGFSYFISGVYDEFRELMEKKSITLTLDHDRSSHLFLNIDRAKMRQVLHNLLNNATKFTPQGGRVVLQTHVSESAVSMTISDSGPGIPPELQPKLFEKFKSGKRQSSGIGLGLYLCRNIVELHQGTIRYSDAPLGGACFIVTIPIGVPRSS
jgi:signal transduction histidine kinase